MSPTTSTSSSSPYPESSPPWSSSSASKRESVGATFFTSGFAETAEEEGIALQNQMQQMARDANFMLVGPNCMGLFIPGRGVRFTPQQYAGEAGPVGFIGQSGTQSMYFSLLGGAHGVKVSKLVSLGNAIVLDVPDYLEYLGQDPETKMIGMYVEGVKNGRRFFDVLKDVCKRKPVVIWKGGQTSDGARAVSSHTASLATEYTVWESLVRQCGALPVHSLEELVDVLKGLLYIAPSTGERMGVMALTGGQAVAAVDAFAKQGFTIGPLSDSSYEELSQFFSVIGASYRNPLDISSNLPDQTVLVRILDILERDPTVDAITTELTTSLLDRRESMGEGYVRRPDRHPRRPPGAHQETLLLHRLPRRPGSRRHRHAGQAAGPWHPVLPHLPPQRQRLPQTRNLQRVLARRVSQTTAIRTLSTGLTSAPRCGCTTCRDSRKTGLPTSHCLRV